MKSRSPMPSRILAIFIFMAFIASPAFAAVPRKAAELPEIDGVYNVPGHPNEKLRVIVHYPRSNANPARSGGKPGPQTPSLVCASTTSVDPDSAAVTNPTGWHLPSSWTYSLNVSSTPSSIGSGNLATIAANAYGAWTTSSTNLSSKVTFVRGADTAMTRAQRDRSNIITWGRTSGSALAVTYTWYDTTTGVASEIDTIFNNKFAWYWANPTLWPTDQTCSYSGVYDAQDILTHELGHTMGLDDEYTAAYTNNTMYGYGATGETKKDTIASGDVAGLSAIY